MLLAGLNVQVRIEVALALRPIDHLATGCLRLGLAHVHDARRADRRECAVRAGEHGEQVCCCEARLD